MASASHRFVIQRGHSEQLGPSVDRDGTNFALYSSDAEGVELELFDSAGRHTQSLSLPDCTDGIWHGYLPGCVPGQSYGFRVRGPYDPEQGRRFNASKLLLDPYAREIRGDVQWCPEIFDYTSFEPMRGLMPSVADSSSYVPKCIVHAPLATRSPVAAPKVPWSETIIGELNVRGYTMLHPAVPPEDRGLFRGLRHRDVLSYLKALGVTSIELMPVHAFVDEEFLVAHGLRNYWGYNSIGFFAPAGRLYGVDGREEFRGMVDAIHDAGLEVILDVVYNHTAEGGRLGPTLSFRGIDNRTYYRLLADDQSDYVNDTGCGNTIDVDQPAVRRLILDSLRYWNGEMGVDGFRFDLAPILGRHSSGFDSRHPLFKAIANDSVLGNVKLIAEPWDVGPGGYQLGGFPAQWAEWNDKYRDAVRRFWRGDVGTASELARRMHGSADIFEMSGRGPPASINLVTAHDGFTLSDSVSYADRHNEANREDNRDGHAENFSCNHGVEGETDDPVILAARQRQSLNMLATLLFSQGTPMLLMGDEWGHTQHGNNNAYAQDNPIGWLDWAGAPANEDFATRVRQLVDLRRRLPLLHQSDYRHGEEVMANVPNILWFRTDSLPMAASDWSHGRAFGLLMTDAVVAHGQGAERVILLINGSENATEFLLPAHEPDAEWQIEFATDEVSERAASVSGSMHLPAASVVCLSRRD